MNLNERQREAVESLGVPLLVVAGAGSGKTRTLVAKLEYLLKKGFPPERILCITFTNKAAKEIKKRIKERVGAELPWTGTFHSIAYKILRREAKALGLPEDFTVADERDAKELLKELVKKYRLEETPEELFGRLSRIKESLSEPPPETLPLLKEYDRLLRKRRLLDFSDLMRELYRLLSETEAGEKWRRYFLYTLVDEYQDTNEIQYEILKLLAGERVCAVGDPNQCIYEWRDARPDNLLKFVKDFNPKVVKLEVNYRSKEPILRLANAVLAQSSFPLKKLIPVLRGVRGEGEKPFVKGFSDEEEEAVFVAKKIKELLSVYPPEEIAVLVRVSRLTQTFERTFFKAGIPYKVVGTLRFYERAEIKALLSLLKLVYDPSDELAFKRVADFFLKGFGEKSFQKVKERFSGNWLRASLQALKSLPRSSALPLYEFLKAIKPLYDSPERYHQLLPQLLEKLGWEEVLKSRFKKDYEERLENTREFLKSLKDFHRTGYALSEVLSEVALSSEEEEGKGVKIMTIHGAKGLEFSAVFIPRLEEGILPHASALEDPSELEEERRLFYVAVTRAKDRLFLTFTRKDGRKASRFLSEIPRRLLDLSAYRKASQYRHQLVPNDSLKAGDEVLHKVFGKGRVLAVDGERATVFFEKNKETKVIHTAFLKKA